MPLAVRIDHRIAARGRPGPGAADDVAEAEKVAGDRRFLRRSPGHGAAVAAAVGVGVVRVAAWTFRMGTDGVGSSAGPARVGISGAKMSTSGGLINRDLEQMSKINGEITFLLR